jgi:hypothetical protein
MQDIIIMCFLVGMVFGCGGDDHILCVVLLLLFAESASSGNDRLEIPARRLSSLDWFLLAPFETTAATATITIASVHIHLASDLGYVVLGRLADVQEIER